MSGQVLFQDALAARLSIIQPSRTDLQNFSQNHPFRFTTGIVELISTLQEQGKVIYLVSGGFRQVQFNEYCYEDVSNYVLCGLLLF
jgi:phosphoserine phosphatase